MIVFINGLHLEEPTRELAEANVGEERADRRSSPIGRSSEDEYIFDFSFPEADGFPEPPPLDEPALREASTPRS